VYALLNNNTTLLLQQEEKINSNKTTPIKWGLGGVAKNVNDLAQSVLLRHAFDHTTFVPKKHVCCMAKAKY